jgi:uncharacterized protein
MQHEIGRIKAIFRYPVKSMAGMNLNEAQLGFHGIEGDRRFAFRRIEEHGGFPWLSASRLNELILFKPICADGQLIPIRVNTPQGKSLEIRSRELSDEISRSLGAEVQLMQLKHGIFDEASLSLISSATIQHIAGEMETPMDVRRFRPNLLIETGSGNPFEEDAWVGRTFSFGEETDGPAVSITLRDKRCMMINLDPDTAEQNVSIMKYVMRLNDNYAGVYASVIRSGNLAIGQKVYAIETN